MNKYLENQDVFLISGGYTYLWAYPDNLLSGDAAKTTKASGEERQIVKNYQKLFSVDIL